MKWMPGQWSEITNDQFIQKIDGDDYGEIVFATIFLTTSSFIYPVLNYNQPGIRRLSPTGVEDIVDKV